MTVTDTQARSPAGRAEPTREEILALLSEQRNWERWGPDDQRGAINLITPEKRVRAARLVRSGRVVSVSRDYPKQPGPRNPQPAQHYLWTRRRTPSAGTAFDYFGIAYHGRMATHIDALSHVWDPAGLWGGRDPREVLHGEGSTWGGIQHWREGIVTRGVLLDVPRHRGVPYVDVDRPIHDWELEEIAEAEGVTLEPGDAVLVNAGREAFEEAHPAWPSSAGDPRPGLHGSCLRFLRAYDVAVLGWDMLEATPNPYGLTRTIHSAIVAFGVALIDNCSFTALADACTAEGRWEFQFTVAPLPVEGGTGSPVNPIALF